MASGFRKFDGDPIFWARQITFGVRAFLLLQKCFGEPLAIARDHSGPGLGLESNIPEMRSVKPGAAWIRFGEWG